MRGADLWMRCGLVVLAAISSGCAIYPRAQNPLPGVFRVAVVDFVDKSNGAAGLNSRKVTEIFASELQKIPSYEVVPLEEVRQVLGPVQIDTNQPQLAFEVARAVHAQAIIVGAITEYNGYYPPRVGLHCEMYAMVTGEPEAIVQSPPIEVSQDRDPLGDLFAPLAGLAERFRGIDSGGDGHGSEHKHGGDQSPDQCTCHSGGGCKIHGGKWKRWLFRKKCDTEVIAGATPPANPITAKPERDEVPVPVEPLPLRTDAKPFDSAEARSPSEIPAQGVIAPVSRTVPLSEEVDVTVDDLVADPAVLDDDESGEPTEEAYRQGEVPDYQISVRQAIDPIPVVEPWVIRHSRVFDSTHLGLMRRMRDYYFFHDDLRGGDWQGYVLRNDDFTRFACNQMIYEMLEAAGGEWITHRWVRVAKPWLPWPPR